MKNLKNSLIIVAISALLLVAQCANAQVISQKEKFGENESSPGKRSFKMTSLPFGGVGVKFTNLNGQFTLMNGGRGSATFNNRFTIGGGGWGMPKGIELESSQTGTFEFFKMGYGGLELGYIVYPGDKINVGTNLLVAYGAGFKETLPKAKNGDFKMFPVLEPSLYSQISLGKILRLDLGISYRYVGALDFPNLNNKKLNGFSCYIAFLVGACKCG